jgi:hypothetical protein
MNLTETDISMAVFSVPFNYTDVMYGYWRFLPFMCPVSQFMNICLICVSIFTLKAYGVERYWKFIYCFCVFNLNKFCLYCNFDSSHHFWWFLHISNHFLKSIKVLNSTLYKRNINRFPDFFHNKSKIINVFSTNFYHLKELNRTQAMGKRRRKIRIKTFNTLLLRWLKFLNSNEF